MTECGFKPAAGVRAVSKQRVRMIVRAEATLTIRERSEGANGVGCDSKVCGSAKGEACFEWPRMALQPFHAGDPKVWRHAGRRRTTTAKKSRIYESQQVHACGRVALVCKKAKN